MSSKKALLAVILGIVAQVIYFAFTLLQAGQSCTVDNCVQIVGIPMFLSSVLASFLMINMFTLGLPTLVTSLIFALILKYLPSRKAP